MAVKRRYKAKVGATTKISKGTRMEEDGDCE